MTSHPNPPLERLRASSAGTIPGGNMADYYDSYWESLERSLRKARIEAESRHLAPGTWVRFVGDGWLGRGHIVLEGMLGRALSNPWNVRRPEVTANLKLTGAKSGFGYPFDWFEILDDDPTEKALDASRSLYLNRAGELQLRRGWMGLVQVGRRIMDEEGARRELDMQCRRIANLIARGQVKEVRGTFRRIGRVLDAFGSHPCGPSAIELARHVRERRHAIAEGPALATKVLTWLDLSRDSASPTVSGLLKPPPEPWELAEDPADAGPVAPARPCPRCESFFLLARLLENAPPDGRAIAGGLRSESSVSCPVCGRVLGVEATRTDVDLPESAGSARGGNGCSVEKPNGPKEGEE